MFMFGGQSRVNFSISFINPIQTFHFGTLEDPRFDQLHNLTTWNWNRSGTFIQILWSKIVQKVYKRQTLVSFGPSKQYRGESV